MTLTRNAGRQSSSVATTSAFVLRSATSRASISRNPRTAFTGWPSGALKAVTGMPKKARNIRLDPSSRSQSVAMSRVLAAPGADGRKRLDDRLELGTKREDAVFIVGPADELHANRQPRFRHRHRHADRRLPGAVEGMGKAEPVQKVGRRGVDVLAQGTQRRRRIGQGRREEYIDLLPGRDQPARLLVQLRQRLQIVDGR